MRRSQGRAEELLIRWEFPALMLFTWLAFIAIPLSLGQIGISWDALNHQIYLGWSAESQRFDLDFLAASYQSYQFPYLYWPLYKLSTSGLSGAWVGAALATLHWLAAPAIWLIARVCIPGEQWFDMFMRLLALVLAFLSALVLSLFDSTSNDLLAAIPFVWSLALAMAHLDTTREHRLSGRTAVLLSGLLAGVSVACKLSNGPLALLLPGLWLLSGSSVKTRLINVAAGGTAAAAGFVLAYGYWGWELWTHFGNPIYPFCDACFAPLRSVMGVHP